MYVRTYVLIPLCMSKWLFRQVRIYYAHGAYRTHVQVRGLARTYVRTYRTTLNTRGSHPLDPLIEARRPPVGNTVLYRYRTYCTGTTYTTVRTVRTSTHRTAKCQSIKETTFTATSEGTRRSYIISFNTAQQLGNSLHSSFDFA